MRRNLQVLSKKNEGKTSIIGIFCLSLLVILLTMIIPKNITQASTTLDGNVTTSASSCKHIRTQTCYYSVDAVTHRKLTKCRDCGKVTSLYALEKAEIHTWNASTGTCTKCGYKLMTPKTETPKATATPAPSCKHIRTQTCYYSVDAMTHRKLTKCRDCGKVTSLYALEKAEIHTWNASTGMCTKCGYKLMMPKTTTP